MNRDEIIARLKSRSDDIARLDVAALSIFGSFARDTATAASDLDVLVRFAAKPTFDRYMDLKALLESVTGRRVDLVTEGALRPELRPQIEREAVRVA
jgi:uncharacterized protein